MSIESMKTLEDALRWALTRIANSTIGQGDYFERALSILVEAENTRRAHTITPWRIDAANWLRRKAEAAVPASGQTGWANPAYAEPDRLVRLAEALEGEQAGEFCGIAEIGARLARGMEAEGRDACGSGPKDRQPGGEATRPEATAEQRALERDAARWRWLRDSARECDWAQIAQMPANQPAAIDAAIDAEIAAQAGKEQS